MIRVAFDIDDTIWKVDRKHRIQVPDYDLINVLRWFANNGDEVFVWSAGGIDYAQTIVDKLGLTDLVKVIPKNSGGVVWRGHSSKPEDDVGMDIAFDDCDTNLAKVDIKVKRDDNVNTAPLT